MPFFFPLPPVKQRKGSRAPAVPGLAALGHGGKRELGEKGEGDEGIASPTSIWVGIRRGGGAKEAGGRWRCGGGAVERGGQEARENGERGMRGFGCPTYLGLEWSGAAWPRRPTAAGGGGPGGGAARRREGLAAAEGFAVVGSVMGGLFIGGVRRWGSATADW